MYIIFLVEANITIFVTSGNRTDKYYQKHYKNMKDLYHLLGWSKHHNLCYQRQPNRQILPETLQKHEILKSCSWLKQTPPSLLPAAIEPQRSLFSACEAAIVRKWIPTFHFSVLCANMLQDDVKDGGGHIDVHWTLSMLMVMGGHWQTKYNFEYFSNKKTLKVPTDATGKLVGYGYGEQICQRPSTWKLWFCIRFRHFYVVEWNLLNDYLIRLNYYSVLPHDLWPSNSNAQVLSLMWYF